MSITGPFLYTDTIRLSNRDYYLIFFFVLWFYFIN